MWASLLSVALAFVAGWLVGSIPKLDWSVPSARVAAGSSSPPRPPKSTTRSAGLATLDTPKPDGPCGLLIANRGPRGVYRANQVDGEISSLCERRRANQQAAGKLPAVLFSEPLRLPPNS